VDRDLKRIYVNPAVKTLWKDLGRIDPQGTRVDQVTATPPSAAKELEDLLRASIADGKRRELHQRVELPDGPHSLHGIIVPERGADGRIETALIVARDVTDAEAAQEALRQSEAHYRALADHIPDQVSRFDRDLKRVYANPAAQRLLAELSVAQPVGKNAEDLPVAARHVSSLVENLRASLAEGKTRTIRERVTMPSGEHVFDVAIVPETNQGQVESLLVTSRDVTESEASKEALRRSEERIRDLMDNLDEVFVSNDLVSGKVVNSAAIERVFGHPKACYDADPMLWSTQLHPEDKGRVMARYVELLAGVPTVDETRIIRPDGSLRWIRASMRPVLDSAGKVVRVDGLLRDITAERATESAEREAQRLREAADFKTQFLNSAAHELATPLTPLKLQLASLRTRMELLPGADRQAFDLLERNVNRLGLLVNDLLDAARLQSGHLRLLPKRLALADLAKAAASSFTDQARAAGIALQLDVRDRDLYAQADESRLTQVLFNLLNNALKFTPSGGHVRLVLRRDGPSALLEVQDDGIGLDRSQMQRLFQPFTQVHDALKVRAGGTGLGLYVTSGIMEQHGGKLEVRSDGPGHGSAFTARLPLSVSSPPSPASSAANERGPPRAADGPGARRAGP
jgi:PAS domain S-box-containing protein